MSQVISVGKEGIDVLGTAGTIPNNLNYSSAYNTLKYYAQGSITVTGTVSVGDDRYFYGTVNHNLGYYPYAECLVQDTGYPNDYHLNSYNAGPAGPYVFKAYFDIGTANLICTLYLSNYDIFGTTTYGTVKFYYKIFRNNLGF